MTIASRPSVGRDRIAIFLFLPGRQAKFGKSEIKSKMPLIRDGGDSVKMDLGGRLARPPHPTPYVRDDREYAPLGHRYLFCQAAQNITRDFYR